MGETPVKRADFIKPPHMVVGDPYVQAPEGILELVKSGRAGSRAKASS